MNRNAYELVTECLEANLHYNITPVRLNQLQQVSRMSERMYYAIAEAYLMRSETIVKGRP